MKEKTIYLDKAQLDNLEHDFEVIKIVRNINCDSIKLTIRNNGRIGTENR